MIPGKPRSSKSSKKVSFVCVAGLLTEKDKFYFTGDLQHQLSGDRQAAELRFGA